MSKINLFFEVFEDHELKDHKIIRLKVGIQLRTEMGWTQPYSAIIDTGAHLSVIPFSLLKEISYQKTQKYRIFGLSKKEECSFNGQVAQITALLVDENGNQTKEITFPAFLAQTDQIPLILGFGHLLEKLRMRFSFAEQEGQIEETEK